jgi:hypothetical protein
LLVAIEFLNDRNDENELLENPPFDDEEGMDDG